MRWHLPFFALLTSAGCSGDPALVSSPIGNVSSEDGGAVDAGAVSEDAGRPPVSREDAGQRDAAVDPIPTGPAFAMDEVQVRGTHNSYHQAPAIAFDDSHKYTHAPLDVQLDAQGVRALELDLHRANSDDSIDVYHITAIDSNTSCLNFEDCLRTLKSWSITHPAHVPVVVWVEIKDDTGGPAFSNLDKVDSVLREELGDRLLTPDDVQGSEASVHDAIVNRGWPVLDDVRGKFLFVILSTDDDISQYTNGYTTTVGKPMFPRVNADKFTSPVAAFAKLGVGDSDTIRAAHEAKLMIATNVCAVNDDDATCEQNRVNAIAAGFHMLKDDLPAPVSGRTYFMALPAGKPVACNPVRASEECFAEGLERL